MYSPTTGLQIGTQYVTGDTLTMGTLTSVGTVTSSTTTTFDANGRVRSSTDANNKTTTYFYNVDSQVVQTLEPVTGTSAGLSICNTYGGMDARGFSEARQVVTAETVVAGPSCTGANMLTYRAQYDANGNVVSMTYPNGIVVSTTYDIDNQMTQLAYSQGISGVLSGYGSTVMSFAQTYNAFGQVATASSPESSQVYAYDGAGRLTGVGDNFEGSCTTRTYSLDGDSNRTGFTYAASTPVAGSCPTTTTATPTATSVFDSNGTGQGGSDRIISSTWNTTSGVVTGAYAYDVLGRQTTIPGVDTQAGGTTASANNATLTYRSDNLISTLSQGLSCEALTYDPLGDVLATSLYSSGSCSGTATTTSVNDYAGSSAPAWSTSSGSTTAYISEIAQGNALNVTLATSGSSCLGIATATCTLNLTDMRGNIVATAAMSDGTPPSVSGYSETTEFGAPRSTSLQAAVAPQYGWLGVHEKAANNLSGLVVMGARIYNPTTGLFTSPDPIYGGNDNPYVYPNDPINVLDLSGEQAPPKALLAALAATARHTAFCKAHPGIEGHSCGGFFHELGGTLAKIDNKIGPPALVVSIKANAGCIASGFVSAVVLSEDQGRRAVQYTAMKVAEKGLDDSEAGLIAIAVVAVAGCWTSGQAGI